MSEKDYAAITIGPILDTLMLTSTPAGLWAASYMFSYISRRLCERIVEEGLVAGEDSIISPYFRREDVILDGVGRYHDRIIFEPLDPLTVMDELNKQFQHIASEIAEVFEGNPAVWFKQYLQFHAIVFKTDDNPILYSSKYLDALELETSYPTCEIENPLNNLLDSNDKDRNIKIRDKICSKFSNKCWPFSDAEVGNGQVKMPDMEDITGRRSETLILESQNKSLDPERKNVRHKINSYYAIVQSDGDNLGKYIADCYGRDQKESNFSKCCFNYCTKASRKIKEYGGIPIYAGGDDLLFIAPLTSQHTDENLFDLLQELRMIFATVFPESSATTLSFGVAIRYYKYPLYEALEEVRKLLFHEAKRNRNAVAVSLQKHSGQSIEFVVEDFDVIQAPLQEILLNHSNDQETLQSISSHLWQYQDLFLKALQLYRMDKDEKYLKNIFDNTFDSDIHDDLKEDVDSALKLMKIITQVCSTKENDIPIVRELSIESLIEKKDSQGKYESERMKRYEYELKILYALDALLRFAKFWGEKGDDENA
jgi:CRISPR-associated protein Cmr2